MASQATDDSEVVTSRWLSEPPAAVFCAIADPDRLARWWGPQGFSNRFDVCEIRPGGAWRFVMVGPNGAEFPNESIFTVVQAERVVVQHLSAPRFELTITLVPEGQGTRIGWRQRFESAAECRRLSAVVVPANEQNLDRLQAELGRG